jgi:hypothetical protein
MGWSGRALPRQRLKLARGAKDKTPHMLHCTEVSQQSDASGQERHFAPQKYRERITRIAVIGDAGGFGLLGVVLPPSVSIPHMPFASAVRKIDDE